MKKIHTLIKIKGLQFLNSVFRDFVLVIQKKILLVQPETLIVVINYFIIWLGNKQQWGKMIAAHVLSLS